MTPVQRITRNQVLILALKVDFSEQVLLFFSFSRFQFWKDRYFIYFGPKIFLGLYLIGDLWDFNSLAFSVYSSTVAINNVGSTFAARTSSWNGQLDVKAAISAYVSTEPFLHLCFSISFFFTPLSLSHLAPALSSNPCNSSSTLFHLSHTQQRTARSSSYTTHRHSTIIVHHLSSDPALPEVETLLPFASSLYASHRFLLAKLHGVLSEI